MRTDADRSCTSQSRVADGNCRLGLKNGNWTLRIGPDRAPERCVETFNTSKRSWLKDPLVARLLRSTSH